MFFEWQDIRFSDKDIRRHNARTFPHFVLRRKRVVNHILLSYISLIRNTDRCFRHFLHKRQVNSCTGFFYLINIVEHISRFNIATVGSCCHSIPSKRNRIIGLTCLNICWRNGSIYTYINFDSLTFFSFSQ